MRTFSFSYFLPSSFLHIPNFRKRSSSRKVTQTLIIRIQQTVKVIHCPLSSLQRINIVPLTMPAIPSRTMSHSQLFMCVKIVAQRALWFSLTFQIQNTQQQKKKKQSEEIFSETKKNIDSINNNECHVNAADSTCGWHKCVHTFPSQIFHKTEKSNRFFASSPIEETIHIYTMSVGHTWTLATPLNFYCDKLSRIVDENIKFSSGRHCRRRHRGANKRFSSILHLFCFFFFCSFGFDGRRVCAQLNFFDFNWRQ